MFQFQSFFLHTLTHTHIIYVIVLCRPNRTFNMKWKKGKKRPRCIRLYNWHNSSNKLLTQKEAKLFITYEVYMEICLVYFICSRSTYCVCVSAFFYSLFEHSARTLSWTILYRNWEIIHRNYTICSSSICVSYTNYHHQHQHHWHHRQHRYYADNRALWYVTIHWKVLISHSVWAAENTRANSFFLSHSSLSSNIMHILFHFSIVHNILFVFFPSFNFKPIEQMMKWENRCDYYFKQCLAR